MEGFQGELNDLRHKVCASNIKILIPILIQRLALLRNLRFPRRISKCVAHCLNTWSEKSLHFKSKGSRRGIRIRKPFKTVMVVMRIGGIEHRSRTFPTKAATVPFIQSQGPFPYANPVPRSIAARDPPLPRIHIQISRCEVAPRFLHR